MATQETTSSTPDLTATIDPVMFRRALNRTVEKLDTLEALARAIELGLSTACSPGEEFTPLSEWRLSLLLVSQLEDRKELDAWLKVLPPEAAA